ncbi:hypothetical protein M6I34_11230 [Burkholderiaceae bacterium FT117]|uniref:hypothetical protein n=1 Tax=Zeimonas sediminis TaxID=2944268 RepID=UPI0023431884|nr:hypothetical protein [Zeimonas sediminis]MCM5571078.1 hypothetical protein [Zeimonas sediminis]
MSGDYVVVTNCTARKRAGAPLVRFDPKPSAAALSEIVEEWRSALRSQPVRLPAKELYVGRSISEAKCVAQQLRCSLFVVSAGLGLVEEDEMVPGYDLSAAGATSGLTPVLARHGASVGEWWNTLTDGRGLRWLLQRASGAVVLLALPTDYLRLVKGELQEMQPGEISRLRVLTSEAGRRELATLPALPVMPYDDRLESIPGLAGTRSDFPQRALRHFTERLEAHRLPADVATREVLLALARCEHRVLPQRARLNDEEICGLIRSGWPTFGGNSARLLRHLRDDHKVACEQGRFAALRRRVQQELVESSAASG